MRLVAGSGRSGTTWVQDALATANRLRPVFEPLHPDVSEIGRRYAYRALGPQDDEPELAMFLEEVCVGRRHRLWTQFRRQRDWLLPSPGELKVPHDAGRLYRRWQKFLIELPRLTLAGARPVPLVKCIRANLMLGWLSRRLGWKTVLIVRHPAAVIESELRGRWNAEFELQRFRQDARLHQITGGRYLSLLEQRMTPIEALAARWVIENQWVVENAPAHGVTVIYYEKLKSSPDREWQRIRLALQLENAPLPDVIAQPSQQSARTSTAANASSDEPWWLRALTREQVGQIEGILGRACVELYSMNDPEPREPGVPVSAEPTERIAR